MTRLRWVLVAHAGMVVGASVGAARVALAAGADAVMGVA